MNQQNEQPTNQQIMKALEKGFDDVKLRVKQEISGVKQDLGGVKQDLSGVKTDIQELKKEDERILKSISDFSQITEDRFDNIDEKLAGLSFEHEDMIIKLNNMVYRFEYDALRKEVNELKS